MATEDTDLVVLEEQDLQDFNPEGILPLSEDEIVTVRKWLAPTDHSSTSSEWGKHHNSYLFGTGSWIWNTDQYQQWHDLHQGGLWLTASTGVGKSVMAATIVSKLSAEEKVPVLYFFFRHITPANQTPRSLVRDYLSQVLRYSPSLQHNLLDLLKKGRKRIEDVSFDTLWNLLVSALCLLPRAYCIVDALDAMDANNETFLDNLIALSQERPASIKVLMTSRPIPRIERRLRDSGILEFALRSRFVDSDISVYIKHRISEQSIDFNLQPRIHDAICTKAAGNFLYARLMIDNVLDIARNTTANDQKLLNTVDELPMPMAHAYTQLLLEHSRRSQTPQTLQVKILQWVTQAERPLHLLELSSLVATNRMIHHVIKDAKSEIRGACGPLLEVFEDETVHPIHHSFVEYLYDKGRRGQKSEVMKFPVLDYQQVQRALVVTCLQNLASGWHTEWLMAIPGPDVQVTHANWKATNDDEVAMKKRLKSRYPDLDYVASYWHVHFRKSNSIDESIHTALDQFLSDDFKVLRACLTWEIEREGFVHKQQRDEDLSRSSWSPLHAAAEKGITSLVDLLIQRGSDIEETTSLKQTPLSIAVRNKHYQAVGILLRNNAETNKPDSSGLKPLHHAARSNHWMAAKSLLGAGVDPFTPEHDNYSKGLGLLRPSEYARDRTPVMHACSCGSLETMQVIIPFLKGEQLQQALYWAVKFGQTDIASEVLQCPNVDVNFHVENHTLLDLSCRSRNIQLMRLLLDHGADANLLSSEAFMRIGRGDRWVSHNIGRDLSPLHALVRSDNDESAARKYKDKKSGMLAGFNLLLKAGADPNITDASGFTVLHNMLAIHRTVYSYRFLGPLNKDYVGPALALCLERGLRLKSITEDGSNALHLASGVNLDVLDMLIDHGVDLEAVRQADGKTPLMAAISMGNVAVAKHFLKRGAKSNAMDHRGNGPIHCVGSLYQRVMPDANDMPDPEDTTPYQDMADLSLLPALIQAGADINSKNHNGDTALHAYTPRPEILSLFVKYGFDLESKNGSGQTLLFQSVLSWTAEEAYKKIVGLGANPSTKDNQDRTILHVLIENLHRAGQSPSSVIQYFVDKGADPQSTDRQGSNLWHKMASLETHYDSPEQLVVMNLLLEYRVSPTARNLVGQTPLHVASSWHRKGDHLNATTKFLFEHTQVDVNAPDYNQVCPIHLTATHDSRSTQFLLEHGANCVAITKEGQTPLMIACRTRQYDIACLLLDHYRNRNMLHLVDQVDDSGRAALHYACRSGRPETVALLLGAGADANLTDKNHLTPLHACAECLEEDSTWQQNVVSGAGYVLLTGSSRPFSGPGELDPTHVRESIRLLVKFGADVSFLIKETRTLPSETPDDTALSLNIPISPLAAAIKNGYDAMTSELLVIERHLYQKSIDTLTTSGEAASSGD